MGLHHKFGEAQSGCTQLYIVYSIGQAGGGNISSKLCAVSVPTVRKFSGFKFVDTALRREDFEDSCSRTSVGHLGDGHFNIMDISRYDDSLE